VQALAIDPMNPANLYAGKWGDGIFKNTRREIKWSATETGLKLPFIYTLAVDSKTPTEVFAGTYAAGVIKSTDGGMTWNTAAPLLTSCGNAPEVKPCDSKGLPGKGISATIVPAIVIDPHDPDTVYAGTDEWLPGKGYAGNVYKSTDAGKTWTAIGTGLPQKQVRAITMDRANGMLFVGTEQGVYRSNDSGTTWNELNSGLANQDVYSLAVAPQSSALYAGTADGVYQIRIPDGK
jgi:photosystem II stability/assembly factor-like uncharacterized protein